MNLPDFLNSDLLNNLRREMGNSPLVPPFTADIFPDRTTYQELKKIPFGLDVDINRKVNFDSKNGTALYKDRRVLLYIRDWSNPNHDPRFHLANCNTIQEFRTGKAFGKFVAFEPENKENALFEVIYTHDNNRRERMALKVCKYCLDHLGYKGYESQRRGAFTTNNNIFENFSIAEYFSIYPPNCFIQNPLHTAQDAPLNDYTPDWSNISNDYRTSKGYTCEKCNIRLNDDRYRKYLHVHHENGLKYDNRPENLVALCICCHAERKRHEHLREKRDYIDFVHMRGQINAGG